MGKKMKIALFHPWIKSRGGAEKVILTLLEKSSHEIDLYTWAYDKKNTFEGFNKFKINLLSPKFAKNFSRMYLLRGLFLIIGLFKKIPLKNYDRFLISTSGLAEFILFRNYLPGKTYSYVHTTLRDADEKIVKWNLKNKYKSFSLFRINYLLAVKIYNFLEKKAWKNIDYAIFNSSFTKKRAMKKGLLKNKHSSIISPPIDVKRFSMKKIIKNNDILYVSRLNFPKRQDVLIEAWKKISSNLKKGNLVLIGTPENKKYFSLLKELSKGEESIKIKSNLSDKQLGKEILSCKGGVFLGYQEDFGIVPVEFISLGKPILAVDEGGYMDMIKENSLLYKIKERHEHKKMILEVKKSLEKFLKKDFSKMKKGKINIENFSKQIDKLILN